MAKRTQALNQSTQTNGRNQLSMSTRTQALNSSMPNQWARSAIHDYTDTSTRSINAKSMGAISYP